MTGITVTWISPESGNWNTGSNWSTGAVPVNGDSVVIAIPGVVATLSTGSPQIEDLTVGAGSTLSIAGGNLAVSGTASVTEALNISSGE